MTQQRQYQNDQFLRKAFDTVYSIDPDEIKGQVAREVDHIKHMNRRILGISMTVIALAVLLVVILGFTQSAVEMVNWQNRPSFQTRLTAPYNLELLLPPTLNNAVWVDAEVESVKGFSAANFDKSQPVAFEASTLLTQVVKMQSILPAQIDNFVLQQNRAQDTLLGKCMLTTGYDGIGNCTTTYPSEFIEAGNFVGEDGTQLSFVMSKYSDNVQAETVFKDMHNYARTIGQIGNFAILDMLIVDYFYSTTRDIASFTWVNENWVFTVSSKDFTTIDDFMNAFPLYEA